VAVKEDAKVVVGVSKEPKEPQEIETEMQRHLLYHIWNCLVCSSILFFFFFLFGGKHQDRTVGYFLKLNSME